jgi:transposase-like protein
MMVLIPVFCPHCQSDQVIKGGKTQVSKQRYKCQNAACPHYSFQLDLTYKGRSPEIKDRIIEMALNGSGIRDTARVLKISPTTVINELKKSVDAQQCELPPTRLIEPGRGGGCYTAG